MAHPTATYCRHRPPIYFCTHIPGVHRATPIASADSRGAGGGAIATIIIIIVIIDLGVDGVAERAGYAQPLPHPVSALRRDAAKSAWLRLCTVFTSKYLFCVTYRHSLCFSSVLCHAGHAHRHSARYLHIRVAGQRARPPRSCRGGLLFRHVCGAFHVHHQPRRQNNVVGQIKSVLGKLPLSGVGRSWCRSRTFSCRINVLK